MVLGWPVCAGESVVHKGAGGVAGEEVHGRSERWRADPRQEGCEADEDRFRIQVNAEDRVLWLTWVRSGGGSADELRRRSALAAIDEAGEEEGDEVEGGE